MSTTTASAPSLVSNAPIPEISVVVPTLDEEDNVVEMERAVTAALEAAGVSSSEIIFIDNGSRDRTVALVKEMCRQDPRVRLIVNARNFGQMRSPTHGIYQARGNAVIALCADFQDPPELISRFVELWRQGYRIVLGVRESERNGLVLRVARAIGYGFLARFGDYPVIPGATGFGLYDRTVVDTLSAWNEPEPFFRGMLVETGLPLTTVGYRRPVRARGRSKNGFRTLFSFGLSALASSSKKLLRVPLILSALLTPVAVVLLAASGVSALEGRRWLGLLVSGLGSFAFSLVLLFLGLLGEQVRIISERTRDVQLVIEKERVNF